MHDPGIYIHISGDQLSTSTKVMVTWWGDNFHPLCRETSDINSIVYKPDEKDTIIASQVKGWVC